MAGYFLHLDESLRGRFLALGGFICDAESLSLVEERWLAARRTMGIASSEPLKWNYSQNQSVRRRIEEEGWSNVQRRREMIDAIRDSPVVLLADVLYDEREGRRGPLDFYRHALDWLVLRFRNFVTDRGATGPHIVVLDQPSPAAVGRPGFTDERLAWLSDRERIWYVHYREKRENGFTFQGGGVRPLREDGFYPSVLLSHAKYNVLLEVADAVAGLALDFAQYNVERAAAGQLPEMAWQDEQFARVASKFRSDTNRNAFNWGFALFPPRTPAYDQVAAWVRRLCTDEAFGVMR